MTQTLLAAVLDRLLPAVDGLPGAGELGLADAVVRDPLADQRPDDVPAVLAALPAGFGALPEGERDAALAAVERALPDQFSTLVNLAYNAYYLDPRTLARVERLTGYAARAPQPDGYEVDPLDERLLEPVLRRPPLWRSDEAGQTPDAARIDKPAQEGT
jgi:hypothetical protein